jgi:ADP-heptose:LPS heptosyltransferase/GT2 family glycosyltransferase
VSAAPKNILYLRPDTFGDIVLFEPALRELMAAWPQARHTILVRPGYESLAPLFPQDLRWQVAPLNPFRQNPAEGRAAFDALLATFADNPPDLIVAATLNRTWLEVALAARLPQARSVALGHGRVDPLFTTSLVLEFGEQAPDSFREHVPADENALEWENNLRLVDHLLGRKVARHRPVMTVPPDRAAAAAAWLREHKLPAGGWAALFPAGVANVQIKAWQPAKFAETAAWLHREHKLPLVLLGHVSEKAILDEVSAGLVKLGLPKPPVWLGRDGEIALLAALLQTARLYFGHDTGAMHLAAALDRPIAAIFGGGHGLRFQPVARQAVTLIQPLPCFGCRWDCHFADAPCVKTLQVADAKAALTKLLAAGDQPLSAVHEAKNLPDETLRLIAASTPRYQQLQQDRLDRQYKIEELTHLGREKDVEIDSLKGEADTKDAEIASLKRETNTKDDEIASLKAETNTKDDEIASLKAEADTKDTEIASLKGEADTKDAEIASLKAEADTKDAEIAQLKAVCNEREALIFKLTDIVKDFQRQVADLNGAVSARDAGLQDREARLADLSRALQERDAQLAAVTAEFEHQKARLASLPPDASQWAQWLYDKDVHIRNIEAMLADRDRQIRERQATIDNLGHGYGELEQIKRYGRWLHEKEAVIQQLARACREREALIAQLTAKAAGLSRIHQASLAVSGYFRQKWWQPLKDKVFKKMVEEQAVQLGVLRQYEPRPLRWDPRLPRKGRLAESTLPAVVIVTPSYNQDKFLESTMLSVLNQNYPRLHYRVQDGGSQDRSVEIIRRYADRLAGWHSGKDRGQSDAIRQGFDQLPGEPGDIMAWLNSDDLLAPRALRFIGEYFVRHPQVDVVYGHRIIIDDLDREIGRWILPPHDRAALEWIDYVPQETLFWRRRAWDAVGGLDPSFQFALDWDLLARFQQAGARIVRLPYFLGCFRLHSEQKTSAHIHTTGQEEMTRIRTRIHGPNPDPARIEHFARKARFESALHAGLHRLGVRL